MNSNFKFPINLTQQQLEAATATAGATLLLAVPGSGKTTVLVSRLGYMIYGCGIAPENILTVTYTVAATRDMKERFIAYYGEEAAEQLEFRTINGICAKILARYASMSGKKVFELITDEKLLAQIVADIYFKVKQERPTEADIKGVRTWITYVKNMLLAGEELKKAAGEDEALVEIYENYCRELKRRQCIDYDDQMVYSYKLLNAAPELLESFQDRYRYICVDEAQDTSKIQHMIIALLARKYNNIFMVGDEDQSIYGFRAAYPEALTGFEKTYPGARILLMEENFRSNARIVEAADAFVQKNVNRHAKHMRASRPAGKDIREIPIKGRRAQYSYLAKVALECDTETAVLYRDNEMAIPLVDYLERNSIDYRLKNTDAVFFTHRVVQDIINIINFAYNPKDTELFMKIYYKLGLYLKKSAAEEACRISLEKDSEVLEAVSLAGEVAAKSLSNCKAMRTHLKNMLNETGDSAINRIVSYMGYGEYLENNSISDSKIFILETLGRYTETPAELIKRLGELSDIFKNKEQNRSKFILSTIHSSKGLEYDTVYLMDVKDELFPEEVIKNVKTADAEKAKLYEEERRLFYVGVTRAKNELAIFTFGNKSSFSNELLGKASKNTRNTDDLQREKPKEKSKYTQADYEEFVRTYGGGRTLRHKIFGPGTVLKITGSNAVVQFSCGTKTLNIKAMIENKLIMRG